jgi:RNA polymerase sigma-70 factor (ECF subfamily)
MTGSKPRAVPTADALTDHQLVRRVLAGETALFEFLVHRHSQRVYRAARAVLRYDDEAADVVQETYLKAFRNLKQFAGQAKFSTWLIKIAIHEARARQRKSKTRGALRPIASARLGREEPTSEPDPEKLALVREVRTILEAAIDTLPDLYRAVFVMRGVEELSTADTAACLNLSEDVVKTRLRRARALMRKKIYAAVGPMRREAFRFAGKRCQRMWAQRILPEIRSVARPGGNSAR